MEQYRMTNSLPFLSGNPIGSDLSDVLMGYVSMTVNGFLGAQCVTVGNNLRFKSSILRSNQSGRLSWENKKEDYTEEEFLCPITQDTMVSPVLSRSCGHTFERGPLFRWLDNNGKCPLCKRSMAKSDMISNYRLKRVIDQKRKRE